MIIVTLFCDKVEEVRVPYDMVILSVPVKPYFPNGEAQIMTIGKNNGYN